MVFDRNFFFSSLFGAKKAFIVCVRCLIVELKGGVIDNAIFRKDTTVLSACYGISTAEAP